MAIQSYLPTSAATRPLSWRWRLSWLPRLTTKHLLVALLLTSIGSSLLWSLYRQEELQDLGSFLHSGAAYNLGLDPYHHYYSVDPQPISPEALNLNPPVSVYAFAGLERLPPQLVSWSFFGATILLFAAGLWLLLRAYPDKREPLVVLTVCSLAGVWHTLGYLQLYAPLVLAGAGAWLLMRRGDFIAAGIAIGLIVAIKPNFVLWPVFLLAAGHTRTSVSALATAAGISAVPLLIDGPEIYRQWLAVTTSFSGLEWASNASLMSIAARFGLERASIVIGATVVLTMLPWLWRRRPDALAASTLAILAILLAGPVSWAGYTLFLLPYLFSRPWNHQIWLSVALLAVPFWVVRYFTVLGPVPNALLGPLYGWAVLLLFAVVFWEQLRADAAEEDEPALATAAA